MKNNQNSSPDWVTVVKKYNRPDNVKSIWQIINSLGPYIILWYLMYLSLDISYFLTLGLSLLAAGFWYEFLSSSTTAATGHSSNPTAQTRSWEASWEAWCLLPTRDGIRIMPSTIRTWETWMNGALGM